ncbi:MAG: hypothetical protein AAF939_08830 [Planctomycetota bacterium]
MNSRVILDVLWNNLKDLDGSNIQKEISLGSPFIAASAASVVFPGYQLNHRSKR